jgi:hypothetical protein
VNTPSGTGTPSFSAQLPPPYCMHAPPPDAGGQVVLVLNDLACLAVDAALESI